MSIFFASAKVKAHEKNLAFSFVQAPDTEHFHVDQIQIEFYSLSRKMPVCNEVIWYVMKAHGPVHYPNEDQGFIRMYSYGLDGRVPQVFIEIGNDVFALSEVIEEAAYFLLTGFLRIRLPAQLKAW